ncbi:MAG: thiamine-phosphate kinase [Planctomycetes bacterium]|nr:thiamine-phosphate kinase [Planctomycetota bacterium]MBI3833625.1 thiamine-phosphate kinase [Planctomycetota bacterium]
MAKNELEFVEWLRRCGRQAPGVELPIGDDMGQVRLSGEKNAAGSRLLLTSDMLLDGVHFDTSKHRLSEIGRKALACSLSDCAAMAVRPVAALVSLALPFGLDLEKAKEIYIGMSELEDRFKVTILGGDTNRWKNPLVIDVAIAAEPYPGIEPRTRAGGRPGDEVYVTGKLGGSILGKHLSFVPRVEEARRLAECLGDKLRAMMDISDGLSLDLWRMCQASGVGVIIDESKLGTVVSDDAMRMAFGDSDAALQHALSDGEDFELLLAVAPGVENASGVTLYRVGTLCEHGFQMQRSDGTICDLPPKGYVH